MFLLLSLHPQQKNLQDDPLIDIEAWLVCGKNKLTVSTLVSILIRHRARTPRTWTDSLLASDDGPTNWLQHFVLINLSEVFFKHYLVQKGGSKSSHHHPTPPHQKPHLSHCSRYLLEITKHVLVEGGWKGARLFCFSSFTLFDNSTSVWSRQIYDSLHVLSCSLQRDSTHLYDGYDDAK